MTGSCRISGSGSGVPAEATGILRNGTEKRWCVTPATTRDGWRISSSPWRRRAMTLRFRRW
ncbi:hypothetical protein [Proteiniphilum saccharofermentans]|uniref:hypothetical protein n=1 Tax=Proteiniphilum saccharofermentans TaxID=1642647 RepID=UPI0012B592D1|nr:hypothetical protein [Proteiniphilum saccharofermentans]